MIGIDSVFLLIFLGVFALVWAIRIEAKNHNLKICKHYALYDDADKVSYIGVDGSLEYGYFADAFTYKQAIGIKSCILI